MIANMVVNPKGTKNISITENGTTLEDVKKYGKASITVNVQGGSTAHIYGAVWDGSSSPAWTRTDEAANFSDPNPYYAGMATTPSSPFDGLMPWSGMRRVTDSAAGELVEIPKFWYKWTRAGSMMLLQIADAPVAGFHVSPAHADRGDGFGERDYVYIGRYPCASDYKSKTGVIPKYGIARSAFRSNIHNLGSNIWQNDFAMYWAIRMLYLVEFANWNSQAMIGYGCGNGWNPQNLGSSDSMPYHTGTIQSGRTTYGLGCQYRYIEELWGDVFNFIDGVYFNGTDIYCIKNPADFSDSTGGTKVGTRGTGGWTAGWTNPTASGFEYALYPNSYASNETSGLEYICDANGYDSSASVLYTGASAGRYPYYGAFMLYGDNYADVGSRLMVLPPSRLS